MSSLDKNPIQSLVGEALDKISSKSTKVDTKGLRRWKPSKAPKGNIAISLKEDVPITHPFSSSSEAPVAATGFAISPATYNGDKESGIYATVEGAVAASKKAQKELSDISLGQRKKMISAMREIILKNAEILSAEAVKETGMGRFESKVIKHQLIAERTPGIEDIQPVAYTGDFGLTIEERAPWGVIASITPVTNPSATIVCNAIGMVAGGNGVVFSPHPSAKEVSLRTIQLLNEAIITAGGPPNLLSSISEPSIINAQTLMAHPDIKLLVVTGGMRVVIESLKYGKKVIAAGPGNPPVVVDETADTKKAAFDILSGASFDNNIPCICEKEVFVVDEVFDEFKYRLKEYGAYELSQWQLKRMVKILLTENRGPGKAGTPNINLIGRDAKVILNEVGIKVSDDIKIVIAETEYEHPFVWSELMMPVLPLVRVRDVDLAIEMAVKAEHGFRHTAAMHSLSIDKLTKMAKCVDSTLFVKNGPSYDGLGVGGEGFPSLTIASFTGEGMTSARHFTRKRRCTLVGYLNIL